ncbi:PepSY domain-containing protein [Lactiplantibacillus mudanjiangensis]|uniref:PepSY domain-containing protein n=1 Tax=Lactiplantibacillus mudanjiangensis TaxID=1296538 RepID=A0A660DV96_9LACO|nr:PepSY domain-containing protein [Lactiplantibacillus mudanjiangensis]VDG23941.1 hypothetical protein [Lactobacillus alimentarius DSM 20249] [Lactiplantibacillus mudanjiangensis]VDG27121.1 hypothetical protein [Lactobacillus alimentarius DSM 20249] [Lactiplantibacillus mudanjiangensis]
MKKVILLLLAPLMLAGCQAPESATESSVSSSSTSQQTSTKTTVANPKTIKVSLATAIKRYHKQFGPHAAISEIKVERENGRYEYDVSGLDQQYEYEMVINANTGKVLRHSRENLEADDQDEQTTSQIDPNQLTTLTKISEAATKKVGGGTAVEWSLDHENGEILWEVKVNKGTQTSEVQVNAYTGKAVRIVKTETTDDDD